MPRVALPTRLAQTFEADADNHKLQLTAIAALSRIGFGGAIQ
jgi:hypothetical protein